MPGEETILFLGVAALSLAIVVSVVAPIVRQRRSAPAGSRRAATPPPALLLPATDPMALLMGPAACAACHRLWPRGFRYCPLDGTPIDHAGRAGPTGVGGIAVN